MFETLKALHIAQLTTTLAILANEDDKEIGGRNAMEHLYLASEHICGVLGRFRVKAQNGDHVAMRPFLDDLEDVRDLLEAAESSIRSDLHLVAQDHLKRAEGMFPAIRMWAELWDKTP